MTKEELQAASIHNATTYHRKYGQPPTYAEMQAMSDLKDKAGREDKVKIAKENRTEAAKELAFSHEKRRIEYNSVKGHPGKALL